MARTRRSGIKELILSLLLVFFSLLIAGLTSEVILRLLGHKGVPTSFISNIRIVNDPILNWRYVPNSELQTGTIVSRYNSGGYRDVEHAVEKPFGTKRFIVVGDSVTEGGGVEWEAVFAHLLQAELGGRYEIINLAMSGLNTPQEIHLLEKEGLVYQPDLVILNFTLNDCDFNTEFYAAQRFNEEKDSVIGILNLPVNPRFKRFVKSSALVYFVKERLENLVGRVLGKEGLDYFVRLWGDTEKRRKITEGFDQLKALQGAAAFHLVVIIWPLITDYDNYRFESIHEWVRKEADNRGFSIIDLLPSFSKVFYRDLQFTAEDNIHPNALGHKLGAEAFITWCRSQKSEVGC